ncbi:hypothetical protein [Pelosinus propionicus]|uniref:Uncharacterized protein n=1 Tax=Pelosinus propionicus DSM 13327 TaxID=1123291 RepID=A0A1I4QAC1_9FIRM|nr:hypothetical protein [Pelosinus propionicus]SFM36550.1 hypothetical protein SAMN04490355_10896 [Pelosinus propionicus DSM 13327]
MIEINLTSLSVLLSSIYIWFLNSFLNLILAKRIGDSKKLAFFIPFYGYFRFGTLIGIHPIWIIIALASSGAAPFLFWSFLPYKHIIVLAAILADAIIVGLSAFKLSKSKWGYIGASLLLGLTSEILLAPFIASLLVSSQLPSSFFHYILPLLSTFVQIPKIVLVLSTSKPKKVNEFDKVSI